MPTSRRFFGGIGPVLPELRFRPRTRSVRRNYSQAGEDVAAKRCHRENGYHGKEVSHLFTRCLAKIECDLVMATDIRLQLVEITNY
jgi:hypothetical protein